jgi:prolyl oligopeptidase
MCKRKGYKMNSLSISLTVGVIMAATVFSAGAAQAQDTDPYLWLEDIESKQSLEWVAERNKHSLEILETDSRFETLKESALKDYTAQDKIAYGSLLGGSVHNFWQDDTHVRGIWRRASLRSYKSGEPKWITLLDLDKLATDENENWVMKGRKCLAPDFGNCLVELSRGGGDAVVTREYDAIMKRFVDGGFITEEAKQSLEWINRDTVLIGTDFGEGTLTDSGYPKQIKVWKRGYPLGTAKLMHEGSKSDVGSFPFASHRPDATYVGVVQAPDFFTEIIHIYDVKNEVMQPLILPTEINFRGMFGHDAIIQMRKTHTIGSTLVKAGSLIAVNIADAIDGIAGAHLRVIYAPDENSSIDEVKIGQYQIYITVLQDVTSHLISAKPTNKGWRTELVPMPENGALNIVSADEWSDAAMFNYESFLQPDTLYAVERSGKPAVVQSLPARFDATDLITEQKFATSTDGTKVPFFVIRKKGTVTDGSTPVMLYGYGGFEISLTPTYLTGVGKLWLENGGAYVVANIRGGGEYGPNWHQAALKENRQIAYDDFIAVAEDLIASGLTSSAKLGIRGGSNGGLLMGVMATQRPDLFSAVICAVPLLDMMRYHTLLAGASWMGEYGNPEVPEERAYIRAYSPYQNLDPATTYPEMFVFTSTKDDRVHPGHARKFTARLMEMEKPVLYYENTEGGHSAAANLNQRAYTDALQVVYALRKLNDE